MLAFEGAMQAGDSYEMVIWNDHFHDYIGLAARNKYLYGAYARVLADHERIAALIFDREIATNAEAEIQTTLDQHQALYTAIEEGQAAEAEQISVDHLNLCRSGIADLLEKSSEALDGIAISSA